ncbi:unnamed protein product [Natator depressus]
MASSRLFVTQRSLSKSDCKHIQTWEKNTPTQVMCISALLKRGAWTGTQASPSLCDSSARGTHRRVCHGRSTSRSSAGQRLSWHQSPVAGYKTHLGHKMGLSMKLGRAKAPHSVSPEVPAEVWNQTGRS